MHILQQKINNHHSTRKMSIHLQLFQITSQIKNKIKVFSLEIVPKILYFVSYIFKAQIKRIFFKCYKI